VWSNDAIEVARVTPLEVAPVALAHDPEVFVGEVVESFLKPQVVQEAILLRARKMAPAQSQSEGFLFFRGHPQLRAALLVADVPADSQLRLRVQICR
jgi:hypothetical protein